MCVFFLVPDKVWNIHAPDKDDVDVSYDKASTKETNEWWTQTCLTNLDLSSNVLTSISSDIANLLDLTVLNVCAYFDYLIFHLSLSSKHSFFQLHDNALTTLPKEIGLLQSLTKLNVSHNKITCLPVEIFKLRDLRQLNLSRNSLTELNGELSDLVMLEVLVSLMLIYGISFLWFLFLCFYFFNRICLIIN